jgi:hypothetical protein
VVVKDPHGTSIVILSERFLNGKVDALAIAHGMVGALAGPMHLTAPHYTGTSERAIFVATVHKAKGAALRTRTLILSAPQAYNILASYGFSDPRDQRAGAIVARIEDSLTARVDAEVGATRQWLHYQAAGVSLDYPSEWIPDFAVDSVASSMANSRTWIIGPADQAALYAAGVVYNGAVGAGDPAVVGQAMISSIIAKLHPAMKVLMTRSADGIYRWLAAFPSADGAHIYVQLGQSVVTQGHAEVLWGDTPLEQVPTNLPVFGRSLDSAALAAGVTSPPEIAVADAAKALSGTVPASSVQDQAGGLAVPSSPPIQQDIQSSSGMYDSDGTLGVMSDISSSGWADQMNIMNGYSPF